MVEKCDCICETKNRAAAVNSPGHSPSSIHFLRRPLPESRANTDLGSYPVNSHSSIYRGTLQRDQRGNTPVSICNCREPPTVEHASIHEQLVAYFLDFSEFGQHALDKYRLRVVETVNSCFKIRKIRERSPPLLVDDRLTARVADTRQHVELVLAEADRLGVVVSVDEPLFVVCDDGCDGLFQSVLGGLR